MRHETPWGAWDAMDVPDLVEELRGLEVTWWIAGGYALEAWAGRSWREHEDIDFSIFRADQIAVQEHLLARGWAPQCADPPGTLRDWLPGEFLGPGINDIWVRRGPGEPWRFQLMLNDGEDGTLAYKRDPRLRWHIDEVTWMREGVRLFKPEVQLLYKSRSPRPKDEHDFAEAAEMFDAGQREWLREALCLVSPGHPWIERL